MLNYPPVVNETCKYCGITVTLLRQGDGRPWRGRLNYWYTTEHRCPESDQAIKVQERERRLLEEAVLPRM